MLGLKKGGTALTQKQRNLKKTWFPSPLPHRKTTSLNLPTILPNLLINPPSPNPHRHIPPSQSPTSPSVCFHSETRAKNHKHSRQRNRSTSLKGQISDELVGEAFCSTGVIEYFQLQKALKPLLKLEKIKEKSVSNPLNFRNAPMVIAFICLAGSHTHHFLKRASQVDFGIWLVELEQPSLKKMINFCLGKVLIYMHPSFYRSLIVKFPLDVGMLGWF